MADTNTPRVFVSHHSSKAAVAEQVEALLAERNVRCWIAPRDVPPGTPFDSAIQDAINECAAVLLLFCANSDKSRHVKRELILGDSAGRPIIPLRLEAIDPGELAYHLADSQWIDWVDGREAVMDRVAAQVRLFAGAPAELAKDVETLGAEPPEPVAPPPAQDERKWLVPALVGALVFAVALAGYFAWSGASGSGDGSEALAEANDELSDEEKIAEMDEVLNGDAPAENTASEPAPADPDSSDPTPPSSARPTGLVAVPVSPTPTPTPQATFIAVPIATATPVQIRRTVQACAGAASDAEYLICADPEFDARARRMGELLSELRTEVSDNGRSLSSFNSQQRTWFNSVKAECNTASCVETRQVARIAELEALLARFQ